MLGKLNRYLTKFSILLITAALIAGMVGYGGTCVPPSQNLEIRTWYDLDDVRDNLAGNYTLMNDLDSTTAGYTELASPTANEGKGWQPIGTDDEPFTGAFDGQGYEIRNLFINRPDETNVGLFSAVEQSGVIENIGVTNATVIGKSMVGSLVGHNVGIVSNSHSSSSVTGSSYHYHVGGLVGGNEGTVSDSYSTGSVNSGGWVGGLVGTNAGIVSNSHSSSSVTGNLVVGGLVGTNVGTVSNSYSAGNVTGNLGVGGLVGANDGLMSKCYATGNVSGNSSVGGLVGWNVFEVIDSYATGSVSGNSSVGGLVGGNDGPVSNSYSTGRVTGNDNVGGLVGSNVDGDVSNAYSTSKTTGYSNVGGLVGYTQYGRISNSYSTGSVNGTENVGGLVGENEFDGTVSNSFWDTETSGQATSDGGTGKNITQMQDIDTFSGAAWNITAVDLNETNPAYIWNIVNNVTYPFLSWRPV